MIGEDLGGCLPSEGLAWPAVERTHYLPVPRHCPVLDLGEPLAHDQLGGAEVRSLLAQIDNAVHPVARELHGLASRGGGPLPQAGHSHLWAFPRKAAGAVGAWRP